MQEFIITVNFVPFMLHFEPTVAANVEKRWLSDASEYILQLRL